MTRANRFHDYSEMEYRDKLIRARWTSGRIQNPKIVFEPMRTNWSPVIGLLELMDSDDIPRGFRGRSSWSMEA